jgi:hypothetical protein
MSFHDEDERREVTHEEARAVLEAQHEIAWKVDTKAIRTVRITILLVGVVFSAWKFRPQAFDQTLTFLSAIALVCSLATGLFTYSESDLFLGPSREYIAQLAAGDFEDQSWQSDLLHTFGEWTSENGEEVRFYGQLLFVTQVLLFLGIVLLGSAILL